MEMKSLPSQNFEVLEDPDFEKIQHGVFILAQIQDKCNVKHIAAEVPEVGYKFLKIQYLKKNMNSQRFTREDKTVYELDNSDVVFKLPHPSVTGCSAQQLEKLSFGINFNCLNVG